MTMQPWQYYDPVFEYENLFQDIEWPWAGHKRFVYDFVRNIKPKKIAELGTHKGTSFFSMCQAVKDGELSTHLSAVDTWRGDPHAGFYDESVFVQVKKIVKSYYQSENIHLIRKTFDEAASDFKKSSIDLLHIDGMHTYQAVKHDLDTWIDKVKSTGVIMFHDTHEKKDDFGVYKLWDELKKQYPYLDFYHSHGLGVIFLSPLQSQVVSFNTIWSRYYDVYYRYDLINNSNKQLQNTLNSQAQQIKSQAQQIKSQAQQIKSQAQQIELQEKIITTQAEINRLEADLHKIKSAKFFKLWQGYNSVKKAL